MGRHSLPKNMPSRTRQNLDFGLAVAVIVTSLCGLPVLIAVQAQAHSHDGFKAPPTASTPAPVPVYAPIALTAWPAIDGVAHQEAVVVSHRVLRKDSTINAQARGHRTDDSTCSDSN